MVLKVEGFKYEKLGTKGVPFKYLEFSCAFGGNHSHAHVAVAIVRPVLSWRLSPGLGSGPGPSLGLSPFWPPHPIQKDAGYWIRTRPLLIGEGVGYWVWAITSAWLDPTRVRCSNGSQNHYQRSDKNCCNGFDRTVVTVRRTITTALSNRFHPSNGFSRSVINCAPLYLF